MSVSSDKMLELLQQISVLKDLDDEYRAGVKTNGAGVAPIEQHGAIDSLRVTGGFVTTGGGFDKI